MISSILCISFNTEPVSYKKTLCQVELQAADKQLIII